jgi:hypothetical protein
MSSYIKQYRSFDPIEKEQRYGSNRFNTFSAGDDEKKRRIQEAVLNQVIEEEKKHDAEEAARILAERNAALGKVQQGGPQPHPEELENKSALLQALTPSDIVCEPLLDPRTKFASYTANTFHKLCEDESRTEGEEEEEQKGGAAPLERPEYNPRFIKSVYQGSYRRNPNQPESRESSLPPDVIMDENNVEVKVLYQVTFRHRRHTRRIPVGVLCRAVGGKSNIVAANISQNQINSQYYIMKVVFTLVQTGPSSTLKADLFIDAALGSSHVIWIPLTKVTDFVWINAAEEPIVYREFNNLASVAKYFTDRMNILTNDIALIEAQHREKMKQLEEEQKLIIQNWSGKYGFLGSYSQLADCIIDAFKPNGDFEEGTYWECIQRVLAGSKFYQEVQRIQKNHKTGDAGDFINNIRVNIPSSPGTIDEQTRSAYTKALTVPGLAVTFGTGETEKEKKEREAKEAKGGTAPKTSTPGAPADTSSSSSPSIIVTALPSSSSTDSSSSSSSLSSDPLYDEL